MNFAYIHHRQHLKLKKKQTLKCEIRQHSLVGHAKAHVLALHTFMRVRVQLGLFAVCRCTHSEPFESRVWGLRVVLSGHFCMSLHVENARRITQYASSRYQRHLDFRWRWPGIEPGSAAREAGMFTTQP